MWRKVALGVFGMLVLGCVLLAAQGGTPGQRFFIQPGTQTAITSLDQLTWKGEYITTAHDGGGVNGGGSCVNYDPLGTGTTNGATAALAVRYIGGTARANRRFYTATLCTSGTLGLTGQWFGDLIEWKEPASAYWGLPPGCLNQDQTVPNGCQNPTNAPALVEVRRWANWTNFGTWNVAWRDTASGDQLVFLYWDDSTGAIWYGIAGGYFGNNMPFLGATKLLDTNDTSMGTDGNCVNGTAPNKLDPANQLTGNRCYDQVGTKYGPFFYRSTASGGGTTPYWKAVNNWMCPIPATLQASFSGKKFLFGGTVGAVGASGHLGPGMRAFGSLPLIDGSVDYSSCPTATPGTVCLFGGGAQSVTTLSSTGNPAVATATMAAAHGYVTGELVTIAGASPAAYNGTWTITVTDIAHFTYAVGGTPTSPATGTITATDVGLPLADYTSEFCSSVAPNAHRDANYFYVQHPAHQQADTGMYAPVGAIGFWGMSQDNFAGAALVVGATTRGLILPGRQTAGPNHVGGMWYGSSNPLGSTSDTTQTAADDCVGSLTSVSTTATLSCPGLTTSANPNIHGLNLAAGSKFSLKCVTPSQYLSPTTTRNFTVISVPSTDTVTFTIADAGGVAGSHTGTGTDQFGLSCGNYGGFVIQATWPVNYIDPGRANPDQANGYGSESHQGVFYAFKLTDLAQAAAGLRDYCAGNGLTPTQDFHPNFAETGGVNPIVLGDFFATWPNIHWTTDDASNVDGTVGHSMKLTYFTAGGAVFDANQQEVVWAYGNTGSVAASTVNSPIVVHFLGVR